jgi:hypothetical protein
MTLARIGLLALVLLVAPSSALAKVPWHTVEVLPPTPIAGQPLTVVVRFWDDAGHTTPATWWHEPTLLEFEGAAEPVRLTLIRTGDATFQAEVTLAEGSWRLVAVQQFAEMTGPAEVELATVIVAPPPTSGAPAPIGAAVIGAALLTAGIVWRGRRLPRRPDPG